MSTSWKSELVAASRNGNIDALGEEMSIHGLYYYDIIAFPEDLDQIQAVIGFIKNDLEYLKEGI